MKQKVEKYNFRALGQAIKKTRNAKAIPFRRTEKKEVCYLTKEEIDGLLNVCNTSTLKGRQDYLMILLLYNTGIRVSEMVSIRKKDVIESNNGQHHLKIMGKGRKGC